MQIKAFTYTKNPKDISKRSLLVLNEPNTMCRGHDISELSDEQQAELAFKYSKLKDRYLAEVAILLEEYDVSNSYRQFNPTKMTDVSVEYFGAVE